MLGASAALQRLHPPGPQLVLITWMHPDAWLEIEPQFAEALLRIDATRVKIRPIAVFGGTPVVDIKSASTRADG